MLTLRIFCLSTVKRLEGFIQRLTLDPNSLKCKLI